MLTNHIKRLTSSFPFKLSVFSVVFFGLFNWGNQYFHHLRLKVVFDVPDYWPINVLWHLPFSAERLSIAIAIIVVFAILVSFRKILFKSIWLTLLAAFILMVLTTASLYGWDRGVVNPIAGLVNGEGWQYYHDAHGLKSLPGFIHNYETLQPTLRLHTQTHPPGPIAVIYVLDELTHSPAAISLIISLISLVLSGYFMYQLLKEYVPERLSTFVTFVYLLVPGIQIYYLSGIDALLAALLLGCLYYFRKPGTKNLILAAFFFIASLFMSFGALFIVPVLVIYELFVMRSIKRSLQIFAIAGLFYFLTDKIVGYNYLHSFRIASHIENPKGFRLFVDPFSYWSTRLVDIAEIVLFFGPALSLLFLSGIRRISLRNPLVIMSLAGIGSLILMFLTGSYRTGETARASGFIYPYLMFMVAYGLSKKHLSPTNEYLVLLVVFAQTVIMQYLAWYFF